MVGIVQLSAPGEKVKRILCYVYDSPLGPIEKILLLSLQSVIESSINIVHHKNMSIKGRCGPLTFWPDNKSLDQICWDITAIDLKPTLLRRSRQHIHETLDFDEMDGPMEWKELEQEAELVNVAIQLLEIPDMIIEEVYMTEIQLRRMVDRTAKEQQAHQSDGDETMTKNEQTISKFYKEAMNIGDEVYEHEVISVLLLACEVHSFQR
jgi:hypothetical protein